MRKEMRNTHIFLMLLTAALALISGSDVMAADPFKNPSPDEVFFFAHPGCLYENPQEVMSVRLKGKAAEEVGDLTKWLYYGTDGSGSWDKRISCMRIGSDVRLEAYQAKNFKGRKQEYGPGNHDISGGWWDDAISSIKVTNTSQSGKVKPAAKPVEKKKLPAKKKKT